MNESKGQEESERAAKPVSLVPALAVLGAVVLVVNVGAIFWVAKSSEEPKETSPSIAEELDRLERDLSDGREIDRSRLQKLLKLAKLIATSVPPPDAPVASIRYPGDGAGITVTLRSNKSGAPFHRWWHEGPMDDAGQRPSAQLSGTVRFRRLKGGTAKDYDYTFETPITEQHVEALNGKGQVIPPSAGAAVHTTDILIEVGESKNSHFKFAGPPGSEPDLKELIKEGRVVEITFDQNSRVFSYVPVLGAKIDHEAKGIGFELDYKVTP